MKRRLQLIALCIAWLTFSAASQAQTPPVDDDFGFGDDDEITESNPVAAPAPSHWRMTDWALTGFLRSDWGFWAERFDDNPWAKGRQSLDLSLSYKHGITRLLISGHSEYDFAYLVDRSRYDDPTLDAYEWDVRGREMLLALSPGDLEITVGRQIVAWGEGDVISPLDVVNPRDQREPGLADLDDLRLPILATRLGWFVGDHRLEAMMIHEADFGIRSSPMGPFSPLPALISGSGSAQAGNSAAPFADIATQLLNKPFRFKDRQERFSWDQQQYLMRWVYKGKGIDLGLYGAYLLDRQGTFIFPSITGGSVTEVAEKIKSLQQADEVTIELDHKMYWMTGFSGAWPWQSFLVKWELGAEFERPVTTGDMSNLPPKTASTPSTLINNMLGVTWTGVTDLVLSFEASKPWFIDRPDNLVIDIDRPVLALRASYSLLRERLMLGLAGTTIGLDSNLDWLIRADMTYELRDGVKLKLGYVHYNPGDDIENAGPFLGLDDHDRIFLQLRWDFQAL